MKRKLINWRWEEPDAQESFAEWVGFPNEEKTAEEVNSIEKLLILTPPLKVLDAGCGTGRHSLEMCRRGYEVTAIDIASTYLDKARREAEKQNLKIEFRFQKVIDIIEENIYEFILAYDHTLGFMSQKELLEHFKRIFRALKKGGKFLLTIAGPKLIPGQELTKTNSWTEKEGKFILEEKYIHNGYRIEHCIVIDTVLDEIKEFFEKQKAYSLKDVITILRDAGFGHIDCFRDLQGNPATDGDFKVFVCYVY